MGAELDFMAKYGPSGVLAILAIWVGRVGIKMLDRWFMLADKIEAALDSYMKVASNNEVAAERRHSDTRAFVEAAAKETRHNLRSDIAGATLAIQLSVERVEDIVLERAVKRRKPLLTPLLESTEED